MSNAILLAPGPVQLHPEVQKILAEPMIHHRTPEFDFILARVLQNLKFLFQTKNPVFMHTSAGSGAMESALVNVLNPGDEVLAIVSGKFGERWADMAQIFGAQVHRLQVDWGKAVKIEDVEKYLKANPKTKIVMTQACETSTGTAHPIEALGKLVATTDALFLVDGITAVGAFELKMDDWHIDSLIAGSQKAVMLPTGLSFIAMSEKAWKVSETAKTPRYYFDLRKELKANKNGETLFSSPVPLVKALDFILSRLIELGLEKHFAQLRRRADFTRAMAVQMGLSLYSHAPSDSVTAINLPAAIDGIKLRAHLEKKYLVTIMGGQDQAKGKIVRIGHMGYILDEHLIAGVYRLAQALKDSGYEILPEKVKDDCIDWLRVHSA